jgi:molybdenum cofactor biosynthesis enzyme
MKREGALCTPYIQVAGTLYLRVVKKTIAVIPVAHQIERKGTTVPINEEELHAHLHSAINACQLTPKDA